MPPKRHTPTTLVILINEPGMCRGKEPTDYQRYFAVPDVDITAEEGAILADIREGVAHLGQIRVILSLTNPTGRWTKYVRPDDGPSRGTYSAVFAVVY